MRCNDLLLELEAPVGILLKIPATGTGTGNKAGVLLALGQERFETWMESDKNAENEFLDLKTKDVSFDNHKG